MSFVVRHKGTGRFLRGHHDWTAEQREALQFNSGLKLVNYVEHGGVHEKAEAMEIVILPSSRSGDGVRIGSPF